MTYTCCGLSQRVKRLSRLKDLLAATSSLISLYLITLTVFSGECRSWSALLHYSLQTLGTSSTPCSQATPAYVLPLKWETHFHTHLKQGSSSFSLINISGLNDRGHGCFTFFWRVHQMRLSCEIEYLPFRSYTWWNLSLRSHSCSITSELEAPHSQMLHAVRKVFFLAVGLHSHAAIITEILIV